MRCVFFGLLLFVSVVGCGGREVEFPDKPASPPQGEPESTSTPSLPARPGAPQSRMLGRGRRQSGIALAQAPSVRWG